MEHHLPFHLHHGSPKQPEHISVNAMVRNSTFLHGVSQKEGGGGDPLFFQTFDRLIPDFLSKQTAFSILTSPCYTTLSAPLMHHLMIF